MQSWMVVSLLILSATAFADAAHRSPDQRFFERLDSIHRGELDAGQLAQDKGTTAAVRQLGLASEREQRAALERLHDVATREDLWLPHFLQDPEVRLYKRLDSLPGPAFDDVYVEQLATARDETHRALEREARDGRDRHMRAYAADELARMLTTPRASQ